MTFVLVAMAIVAVTSAVHGAVGFGVNLLAVPVLVIVDPAYVPGPAVAAGLLLSVLVARGEGLAVDRRLGWAAAGLLPGTAAALLLLTWISSESLSIAVGVAVLLAVVLVAVRWRPTPTRATLAVAGVASGFLATAASVGGPPLALVYADSDGARLRANLSSFFVLTSVVALAALTVTGHFNQRELRLTVLLVPAVVVGYLASRPLRSWVDAGHARSVVLALSATAGTVAVVQGIFF